MKIKPTSSLILLITLEEKGVNRLVFAYHKQLNDINPPKLSWKISVLWKEKNIKQWLAYGNDSDTDFVWKKIIDEHKVIIESKEYIFSVSENVEICEFKKDNVVKLKFENHDLPQYLFEEDNLLQLEGYSPNKTEKIKPITPPGLFSKGYLLKELTQGYMFVSEKRTIFHEFRGNRAKDEKGPAKQIIGFYQGEVKDDLEVELVDELGNLSGKTKIDKINGIFKADLNNPTGKGRFLLKEGQNIIEDSKYVFLTGATFNPTIVSSTFTDTFERETAIGTQHLPAKKPDNFTWQKDILASEKSTMIELSDYIKNLLNYLGPDILICDPYFLGKMPPENNDEKISYSILMNAILTSSVDYKKSGITFFGYWNRLKNILKKDNNSEENSTKREEYFNALKQNLSNVINDSKFGNILSTSNLHIINSTEEFHNRYWIGLKEHNGKRVIDTEKVFLVTNSTNGMYSSGEIDFIYCDNNLQVQRIASKYDRLLNTSTERYEIK